MITVIRLKCGRTIKLYINVVILLHALCEGNINDDLNKLPTLLATDFEIT